MSNDDIETEDTKIQLGSFDVRHMTTDQLGALLTTDQRGAPRKIGAACDQGAVEANAKPSLTALIPSSVTSGAGAPICCAGPIR